MAIDRTTCELPLHYEDAHANASLLMPFLLAPFGRFQDTLILGPKSIAKVQRSFVEQCYRTVSNIRLRGIAVRAFMFRSRLCIALLLPSDLVDEGGREGATLCIGFVAGEEVLRCRCVLVARYVRLFLATLNHYFSVSLPSTDAVDKLLATLVDAPTTGDVAIMFNGAADSLLFSSQAAEALVTAGKRRSYLERVGTLVRKVPLSRPWQHTPKVILYDPTADVEDIVQIFAEELGDNLSRLGQTGVQYLGSTNGIEGNRQLVSLIPLPNLPTDAKGVKSGRCKGKPYICVY